MSDDLSFLGREKGEEKVSQLIAFCFINIYTLFLYI